MKTNNWHVKIRKQALEEGVMFRTWNTRGWHITTAFDPNTGRFGLSFCRGARETYDRQLGQALAYNRMVVPGRKFTGITTRENWRNTPYLVGFCAHVNGDMLPSHLERKLSHILQ